MSFPESRAWTLLGLALRRVNGRRGRAGMLLLALVLNQVLVLLAAALVFQVNGALEPMTARGSFGLTDLEINRTRHTAFHEDQLAAIRAWPNVAGVFVGRGDDCPLDNLTTLTVYHIDPGEASRCRVYRISRGRYLQERDTESIVVGEAFAASRNLSLGGQLLLGTGTDKRTYTIVGLASKYGLVLEGDARHGIAFLNAPALARPCDDVSFVLVRLVDRARADQTAESLQGYLGPGYPVRKANEAGDARFAEISAWVGRVLMVVTTTSFGIILFVSVVLAVHMGRDDVELRALWQAGGFSRGGVWGLVLVESGLMATLAAGITMGVCWLGSTVCAGPRLGVIWNPPPRGQTIVLLTLCWVGTWGALTLGRCLGMAQAGCHPGEELDGTTHRRWWSLVSIILGAALVLSLGRVLRTEGRTIDVTRLIWIMSATSLLAAAFLAHGLGSLAIYLARRILSWDFLRVRLSPLGFTVSLIQDGRVTACGLIGCTAAVLGLGFLLQTTIGVLLRAEAWASAQAALLSFSSGTAQKNAVLLEKIDPGVKRVPVTMAQMELGDLGPVTVVGIPYGSLRDYDWLSESWDEGRSLSEDAFHQGCFVSGSLVFEHHIGLGDCVYLQRGETQAPLRVLALLPPPVSAGSIVCDARLLQDQFHVRGPTHYLLLLPPGMTSSQATAALLASADNLERFRVRDLQEADAAAVAVLHRCRKWLWWLVGCLLALGAAGAGNNVGLQSSLRRHQSYFREIGAPVSRVTWEACLAVLGLVLVGTGLGAWLGHVQAALILRWLFHNLALGQPELFRSQAEENVLTLMGGTIVLVVSFLAILIVGRLRGPDTATT